MRVYVNKYEIDLKNHLKNYQSKFLLFEKYIIDKKKQFFFC